MGGGIGTCDDVFYGESHFGRFSINVQFIHGVLSILWHIPFKFATAIVALEYIFLDGLWFEVL